MKRGLGARTDLAAGDDKQIGDQSIEARDLGSRMVNGLRRALRQHGTGRRQIEAELDRRQGIAHLMGHPGDDAPEGGEALLLRQLPAESLLFSNAAMERE